jgi:hypothetical protein
MDKENNISKLTDKEEEFCYLYVYGDNEFAGQAMKCYEEVFGEVKNVSVVSRRFLSQPHILSKVKELIGELQSETETLAVKLQIVETLKAVMEETSTAQYSDKFGISLSPAPLRAVSVNAAKALMDLFPIKSVQEAKLRIEGSNSGVVFNVIVPEKSKDEEENQSKSN